MSKLRTAVTRAAALGLLACVPSGVSRARAVEPAGDAVLVELFTSQGCSSCPSADAHIGELLRASSHPIVALTYHVDYWDRLGWKDKYASPAFTARQRAYAHAFGDGRVYTPQMIIDGAVHFSGSQRAAAKTEIDRAARRRHPAILDIARAEVGAAGAVHVVIKTRGGGPKTGFFVALAETETATRVSRGENAGEHLREYSVVRALAGPVAPDAVGVVTATLAAPPDVGRFRVVAFAQDRGTFHVQGATAGAELRGLR